MKRPVAITALLLFAFTSITLAQSVKVLSVQRPPNVRSFVGYAPRKIVVKFDDSILSRMNRATARVGRLGIPELDQLGQRYDVLSIIQQFPGAKKKFYRGRVVDLSGWHKIKFARDVDVEAAVRAYKRIPGIIEAQPIGIHAVYGTPNDPNFGDQWHLNQANDADIDAPEAWDIQTGNPDIIVAILDTGVRYFHKDLGGAGASSSNPGAAQGNMWINWAEKNGTDGVDDDGNGFVDDWIGWDFVQSESGCWPGEDCSDADNDPRDFNGHGTHVSGIVGAINNNGYAVASTAGGWGNGSLQTTADGVRIMPLRIGWSSKFFIFELGLVSMDYAAQAFRYAADNGARLANASWGSSNTGGLGDAIDYFLASGGLIFHAAGNDGADNPDYMSSRGDIIDVAATDADDCKASFSNFGTWVDISAPGDNIWSTYHDHNDPNSDVIASLSGTSMASPMALSVAALIWSQNPSWSASQVKQRLFDTADDITTSSCNTAYIGKLGAGRVNAFNAVNTGTPPPTAAFTASPTSGCAPLSVNFTDQSTGDIDTWSWDFGDGSTSSAQNPTHEYTSAGTYTVSLTVTGPGGSDTDTKTDYITVSTGPTAAFSGSPTSGTAPLTVSFTDESTGNPTSWSWDFGDGSTSTQQNPTHEYASAGTYTVSLTATNDCGSSTETKVDYITVTEPTCDTPVADFTGSPTSGTAPLTVNFTDQSTNSPTSWSWDFGDGTTSTLQNPSHEYTAAGTYTVKLTATNSCGSDTKTRVDYITVTAPTQQTMHVNAMEVTKEQFRILRRGKARVQIVDANGSPVADATVTGEWSGGATDTDQFTTDSDGWGTAFSDWRFGDATFTFCVTNVSKNGWTYDSNANVVTCASTDGTSSRVGITSSHKAAGQGQDDLSVDGASSSKEPVFNFNYPNPFNPSTTISFRLPKAAHVTVEVYDVLGKKVATLLDDNVSAGAHSVVWNAKNNNGQALGSGLYFYRITVDGKTPIMRRMLLLK